MPFDPNTIANIALAGAGGAATVAIWALRLEGRLNTHEKAAELTTSHDKESFADLKAANVVMDVKLDELLKRSYKWHT